jgi:hypothetical protein
MGRRISWTAVYPSGGHFAEEIMQVTAVEKPIFAQAEAKSVVSTPSCAFHSGTQGLQTAGTNHYQSEEGETRWKIKR